MDEEQIVRAVARITARLIRPRGAMTFTVEHGHGETYQTDDWTIYAHDTYPQGSVLAGQPRRTHIASFGSTDDDQKMAMEACMRAGVNFELISGTTFQAPDLSHLPNDEDY